MMNRRQTLFVLTVAVLSSVMFLLLRSPRRPADGAAEAASQAAAVPAITSPRAKLPAPASLHPVAAVPAKERGALAPARFPVLAPADSPLGRFQEWQQRYLAASPVERAALEAEGAQLAAARRPVFKQLIKADPREALRQAVPMVARQQLPAGVVEQLEERVSGNGVLRAYMAAPEAVAAGVAPVRRVAEFEGGRTYNAYVYGRRAETVTWVPGASLNGVVVGEVFAVNERPLRPLEVGEIPPANRRAVTFCPVSGKESPAVNAGDAIEESTPAAEVRGEIVYFCDGAHIVNYEQTLIYAEGSTGGPQRFTGILPAAPSPSVGQLRVLFLPMTFADQNQAPTTEAKCYEILREVSDFYFAASFGRLTLQATVTPPVKLPHNAAWYTQKDNTDGVTHEIDGQGLIHNHAREEARKLGYDANDYDCVVVRLNGGPGGGVSLGGGSSVWLYGDSVSTTAHEVGHCFGLAHANFWDTGGASAIGAGANSEYGDTFDNMGSASPPRSHYNIQAKSQIKWLPDDFVQTVTESGVYRIYAMDQVLLDPDKRYALKIAKDNQRTYWGEVRALYDGVNNWVSNGLILGWKWPQNSGNNIQLIDTTPGSPGVKNDSPIVVGQTFSDFEAGIHFTTIGVNTTSNGIRSVDVVVNFGNPSTNLPPTLALAASGLNVPVNTPVTFTATASDPNGDPIAYQWLSSDNATANTAVLGPNARVFTRSFSTAGQYVINCVASDMKGGTSTRSLLVTVGNGNARYSISGRITLDGVGLPGVYVSTGANNAVLSDDDGYYSVPNLTNGTYSVVPLLYGYAFTDLFNNSVLVGPNFSGGDFEAEFAPRVSITATVPTAYESNSLAGRFTITRTGSDADPLDVRLVPASGTAISSDYNFSPVPVSSSPYNYVTIPAGTNSIDVLVTPVDDAATEGPETVVLQLGLDPLYIIAGSATATVVIEDNDTPLPKVSITASTIPALENPPTPSSFTVTRTGATTSNLTVNLSLSGTASNGVDYVALATNVVIPSGSATATITVTPIDDAISEGFETVVTVIAPGAGYVIAPTTNNATVTIVDDDFQVVSVAAMDSEATEVDLTVPGAVPDPALFVLTRTGDISKALTVYYALSGTALHGVDYEPLPGSVTFLAGAARATVGITPVYDNFGEAPETVILQIASGGTSYRLGATNNATININDAGNPPYVDVLPWGNASEPSTAGKFRFTLKGSVGSNVVVNYAVSGTAVGGVDYSNLTGTVTIPGAGTNNLVDVSVFPINNATPDELRTVTVTISASSNYATWQASRSATIWLFDDEQPTVFVDAHTTANNGVSTLTEGGGTNKFYLSRTGSTNAALTVNFTLGGTAQPGVDYTSLSNSIVIPAGKPGVDLVITNVNDAIFEGTETITLDLAPGAYGRGPGAVMYLLDNETSTLRVGFPTNSSVVAESAGVVNVPVWLSATSAVPVGVEYLVLTSGTAASATVTSNTPPMPNWLRLTRTNNTYRSYFSSNGVTWFQIGGIVTNVFADPVWIGFAVSARLNGLLATGAFDNVTITPDPGGDFVGRDVGFVSAFGSYATNGSTNWVSGSGANLTTGADEFYFAAKPASGDFAFTARVAAASGGGTNRLAGLMVREDMRSSARHVFVAQQNTNQTILINRTNSAITAQGMGVDFDLTPGIVTFAPGVTNASIPITIIDDRLDEPNEHVVLTLRNASNAVISTAQHVLVIRDNDTAPLQPSVGFASATNSAPEATAAPVVLVALSQPATGAVSVAYSAIGGSAVEAVDYSLAAGSLNFAAGETVKALPLALLDNSLIESNRTIVLALSNAVGATLTTLSNQTFTILDDDLPMITVVANDPTATEGSDTGQWTFTRTGSLASGLTINFTRAGTATSGTDYTAIGTNVTFAAGSNLATLTLTALADAVIDTNETVILTLAPGTGYGIGSPSNATVTITDVNIPTVNIVASSPNASETGPTPGAFTITRIGPTNASLTVSFSVTGTASNGVDFTSIGTSTSIAAGQSNKVVTVTPVNDSLTEGPEYVVVSLNGSANYAVGSNSYAAVTIADNDNPPTLFISQPNAKTVRLAPGNGLNLAAVATDDGAPNPLTLAWSKYSGPGAVVFGSPNSTNTTATFASNGLYILRITATDGQFSVRDDVTVEVGGVTLADWFDVNLGASSTRGKSGLNNGVLTVTGSGSGFNATTDSAHFVCRQVVGTNASMVARLTAFAGTTTNALAGVMIRERNYRGSRRMLVGMRTNGAVELHVRTNDTTADLATIVSTNTLPRWLKVERVGSTLTAYQAPDVSGAPGAWVQVGASLTNTNLRGDCELGATASNGGQNTLADATFDNLTLTPAPVGSALAAEDMGTPTLVGSSSFSNGVYTMQGANNVNSDGGQFRFQQYVGDLTVVARMKTHNGVNDGSKAGVMVRDTSLDSAPFGFMGMAYIRGGYFSRRNIPGGTSSTTLDNSFATNYWLRVIRKGNTVSGWKAVNTASNTPGTWVQRGSVQVFSAEAPVYVGLAVDNSASSPLNTALLDNLSITPGNTAPVVNPGPGGSLTTNTVSIDATVTDDGDPNPPGATSYQWSQVSGPGTVIFSASNAVDTTVTFPTNGTYVLRLSADDGEASVFADTTYNVAFGSPYAVWQLANFGSATNLLAAPDADPDGDGLPNLAEYGYGTNPNVPNAAPFTFSLTNISGSLYARVDVPKNSNATDVQYSVLWAGPLTNPPAWLGLGLLTQQNTPTILSVRDGTAVGPLTNRVYRVQITKP